jgi:uncharacterized protein YutE (UPF0331/DUF86 family)
MPQKIHYNIERIAAITSDIGQYIKDFQELDIRAVKDLADKRNFYAVSMIMFTLLNRVFDLGSEVTIAHNMGIPSTYREIFTLLRKNGLIDESLASDMIGMVTFRNLLSHEYHGIDEEKLFILTTKLTTLMEFVDLMQNQIRKDA